MSASQLARFKQRAITDGHYYPGCPTRSPRPTNTTSRGEVVWVEGCTNPPNLTNQVQTVDCAPPSGMDPECTNTEDRAGLVIWHCGRADMAGGCTYRGILYMVNNSDGTCAAEPRRAAGTASASAATSTTRATCSPRTAASRCGARWRSTAPACMKIGSNGAAGRASTRTSSTRSQSYGTVGLVQNTWRELDPKDA